VVCRAPHLTLASTIALPSICDGRRHVWDEVRDASYRRGRMRMVELLFLFGSIALLAACATMVVDSINAPAKYSAERYSNEHPFRK